MLRVNLIIMFNLTAAASTIVNSLSTLPNNYDCYSRHLMKKLSCHGTAKFKACAAILAVLANSMDQQGHYLLGLTLHLHQVIRKCFNTWLTTGNRQSCSVFKHRSDC